MTRTSVTTGYVDFVRRATPAAPPGMAFGARSAVWARFAPGQYEDRQIRPWLKILWTLSGLGSIRVSGRVYTIAAGSVAVFLPGMRHEAWASTSTEELWETRWITMDGPLCGAIAQSLGVRAGAHPMQTERFISLFDRYREAIAAGTLETARAAELIAHEILLITSDGTRGQTRGDSIVSEAVSLMRLHWSEPQFGIAQLAEEIGVHRSVLSRRFHAEVGVSPQQYLSRLRLTNALTLLRSTDLSIREISVQCGFADPGYFTRLFRETQGTTPGEFRQEGV